MPTPSWRQRARFQPRQGRRGGWSAAMAQPRARILTGKYKPKTSKEKINNLDNDDKNKRQKFHKLGLINNHILLA
jgi:hypothetical protein